MLANRVREFTTTVGTGDITLGGPIAGHVRFADAFAPGDSIIYVIEDGDNYEIGSGTLRAGGILERTDVSETLDAGTLTKTAAQPLSLSGQARLYCAATAKFLLERDLTTDVIREVTPGAGITAGGVLLKDAAITAGQADFSAINEGGMPLAAKYLGIADAVAAADTLTTPRTITITGGGSGSTSFDGSADAAIDLTIADDSHNHSTATIAGLDTALAEKFDKSGGTITGDLVIGGELMFSGSATVIDTTTLNTGDNIIVLNADLTDTVIPTEDAGFEIYRGQQPNRRFLWRETEGDWFADTNFTANGTGTFSGDLSISATKKLYFDGGTDTYITERTANTLALFTGGVNRFEVNSAGNIITTGDATFSGDVTGNNFFANFKGDATNPVFRTNADSGGSATGIFGGGDGPDFLAVTVAGVEAVRWDASQNATFSGDLFGEKATFNGSVLSQREVQVKGSAGNVGGKVVFMDVSAGVHRMGAYDWDASAWQDLHINNDALVLRGAANNFNAVFSGIVDVGSTGTKITNTGSIRRLVDNSSLLVGGGITDGSGGTVTFFGGTHATQANDTIFRAGGVPWLDWDNSAGTATFSGQILASSGTAALPRLRTY